MLYRSKNRLSVQNRSEILCDNNSLPNQLLLSSEIGPFECHPIKNTQISMKSIEIRYGSTDFDKGFTKLTHKLWQLGQILFI